jgi:hypothetical protein
MQNSTCSICMEELSAGVRRTKPVDRRTACVWRMRNLEKAGIRIAGDAGEMLDEQAKDAYRPRLSQLREEAKRLGEVATC